MYKVFSSPWLPYKVIKRDTPSNRTANFCDRLLINLSKSYVILLICENLILVLNTWIFNPIGSINTMMNTGIPSKNAFIFRNSYLPSSFLNRTFLKNKRNLNRSFTYSTSIFVIKSLLPRNQTFYWKGNRPVFRYTIKLVNIDT